MFRRNKQGGYIILTTHNYKADSTNANELQQLNGKLFSFQAEITGEFSEKAYPADEMLQLKEGAQVMFIKNDSEKSKRYFNGKIGIVTKLGEEKIFVQCKDEPDEIEVKKEKWENIRYTLNKNTRRLDEEILGSFTQYPLRLAWAITIHKSQGLTFENPFSARHQDLVRRGARRPAAEQPLGPRRDLVGLPHRQPQLPTTTAAHQPTSRRRRGGPYPAHAEMGADQAADQEDDGRDDHRAQVRRAAPRHAARRAPLMTQPPITEIVNGSTSRRPGTTAARRAGDLRALLVARPGARGPTAGRGR